VHTFSVLFLRLASKNFRRFSSDSLPFLLLISSHGLSRKNVSIVVLKAPNMHTKRDSTSSEHYLSIFESGFGFSENCIEPKPSSGSERERKEEKSWVALALMGLICVPGLALFMSTTFSAFFMHFSQLHHENERKWTENTKKVFVCAKHHAPLQLQAEMIVDEVFRFCWMLFGRELLLKSCGGGLLWCFEVWRVESRGRHRICLVKLQKAWRKTMTSWSFSPHLKQPQKSTEDIKEWTNQSPQSSSTKSTPNRATFTRNRNFPPNFPHFTRHSTARTINKPGKHSPLHHRTQIPHPKQQTSPHCKNIYDRKATKNCTQIRWNSFSFRGWASLGSFHFPCRRAHVWGKLQTRGKARLNFQMFR
jgi:hypothetical protein